MIDSLSIKRCFAIDMIYINVVVFTGGYFVYTS